MTHKKRARKAAGKSAPHRGGEEVPVRDEGQVYGRVMTMLGNGRLMAACGDGLERMCLIRGSMRKREWVRPGDTILVSLREYQDGKADVVHKYDDAEVSRLRAMGQDLAESPQQDDVANDDVVTFEKNDEELDWDLV